ncbi:FAD-dependent monooxygenase [Nocardia sp. NPDC057440]|uniref:FAD-dependent monooxygenase n=1 Tax=Nocardia sp. NPDC057440 TaxID=3346134 RepID=UPI00366A6F49
MVSKRRILVIGGGIGGLTAGVALGRKDVDVTVVEIKPDNTVAGVGINIPGNALRALRRLDLLDDTVNHGYTFDRVDFHDSASVHLATVPSKLGIDGVPANCAIQRRDLAQLLEKACIDSGVDIRYGTTVETVTPAATGVRATLTDGTSDTFDLVVAFDGIRSSQRKRIFGVEPVHTGYSVWRVALPRHTAVTSNMYFQGMGTKAGLFPLNEKTMYLLHVTPEPGNPRHEREQFFELLQTRLDGYTGLIGDLAAGLVPTDDIVYAPIEEVFLGGTWYRDGVLVLGDAAHAMAPHRTQGAAMAIEDAVALGEVMSRPGAVTDLVGEFQERRFGRCKMIQDASKNILLSEMNTTDQDSLDRQIEFLKNDLVRVAHQVDDELNTAF